MRFIWKLVGKLVKFGLGEYALITGLNCGPYPEEKVPDNTRLVSTHLKNSSIVRSYELEAAFAACNNKDDAWKLSLVHFVDGVLYSHDANSKVDMYLFSLVECEEDFLNILLVRSPLRWHFLEWTRTWSIFEAFTWSALRREMRRKMEIPNTLPKPSTWCMVMQSPCNIGLIRWLSSLAASMQHVLVWRLQECYLGLQIKWFRRTIWLRILTGKRLTFLSILGFF